MKKMSEKAQITDIKQVKRSKFVAKRYKNAAFGIVLDENDARFVGRQMFFSVLCFLGFVAAFVHLNMQLWGKNEVF